VPTTTPDARRERLLTFLNRYQSVSNLMGASVLVHQPRLEQGANVIGSDYQRGFFLMTSAIDLMVKGLEQVLPLLKSLQAPAEVAPHFQRFVQGADLYFDGLKRINWGLVQNDDAIFRAALTDYLRGADLMSAAQEGLKATAAQYGITLNEDTGVWQ